MKTFLMCFAGLLLSAGSLSAQAPSAGLDIGPISFEVIIDQKRARPFVAFTVNDICLQPGASSCQITYKPDDLIRFAEERIIDGVKREIVYFEGRAQDYVELLNQKERELTALGYSLRDGIESLGIRRVPVDVKAIRAQLLEALNAFAPELLDRVQEPLLGDQCPLIPELSIDQIPPALVLRGRAQILKVQEVLGKLNDAQRTFCAIGYSMFDFVPSSEIQVDPAGFAERSIGLRDRLLEQLGLSEYLSLFNLESFEKLKSYPEIAQDIDSLVKAKQLPGPEQLQQLRRKLNVQLPPELQIPNIPNLPAPVPPKRIDLALKKRKDWSGFNFGKQNLLATGANAYLEVRGSELTQTLTAAGNAGFQVLGQPVNVLGAFGYLEAGPQALKAEFRMQAAGQNLFEPIKEERSVAFTKDVPLAFQHKFERSASERFLIGPVPVNVSIGGLAEVGLGFAYGIETTRLQGAVYPQAAIAGLASGGVGEANLIGVGAEARITILDLRVPLTGSAGFRFDEVGYPALRLQLNSEATYEYLNGRISAYAEYPVPRLGLPPYKVTRDTLDIYSFKGQKLSQKIMNWQLDLGRSGARVAGDLIDQVDLFEAEELQEQITLDQRKSALADYEARVRARSVEVFQGILTDSQSPANTEALLQSGEMRAFRSQFDGNVADLEATIAGSDIL